VQPSEEFEPLVKQGQLVRSLARHLLFDDGLAQDAVQQAWVAMLEKPPQDRRKLGGWFATVAKNFALKTLRGRGRAKRRDEGSEPPRGEIDPAEAAATAEIVARLTGALLELKEPYRRTLLMRYYEDLGPREIAQREGVSVEAIRSRLQRGAEMLRSRLDRDIGGQRGAFCAGLFLLAAPPGAWFFLAPLEAKAGELAAAAARSAPKAAGAVVAAGAAVALVAASIHLFAPAEHEATTPEDAPPGLPPASVAVRELVETEAAAPAPRLGRVVAIVRRAAGGAPARGVALEFLPLAVAAPWFDAQEAFSDENGRCIAEGVPLGAVEITTDRGARTRVALDGSLAGVVEVELEVPLGIAVRGIVRDAHGRGVAGAAVRLAGAGDSRMVARCDESGAFAIDDVPAGSRLAAEAKGHAPSPITIVAGAPGDALEVALELARGGASLTCRIEDAASRASAARLRVTSSAPFLPRVLRSGEDGVLVLEGLPAGALSLLARSTRSAPTPLEVALVPDAREARTLRLAAGAVVLGRVLDPTGRPAPFARVLEIPETPETLKTGEPGESAGAAGSDALSAEFRCDADGHFAAHGLVPGRASLLAVDDASARGALTSEVADTGITHVELRLEAPWRLAGRVLASDGAPPPRGALRLRATQPAASARLRFDADAECDEHGDFAFPRVPPGDARLAVIDAASGIELAVAGAAKDGSALALRLAHDPATRISIEGRVAPLNMGPGSPPLVELAAFAGGATRLAPAQRDGAFRFSDLSAGAYLVRARGAFGVVSPWTLRDAGAKAELRLELPAPALLEIESARDDLVVEVRGAGGEPLLHVALADAAATARSKQVPPGAILVIATDAAGRSERHELTLEPGERHVLSLGKRLGD
jgi:RNA polymerase sigma factor (sigma-70 family)